MRKEAKTAAGSSQNWLGVILLVSIGVLLTWLHLQYTVGPQGYVDRDFMSLWAGGKSLLLGLNPYDETVWRPLRATYGGTWPADARAPFPLWTFVMTTPLALLSVRNATALWLTTQQLLLAGGIYLFVTALERRQPRPLEMSVLVVFTFVLRPSLVVLLNGQMTFLLLTILVLFLLCMGRDRPLVAGMMLPLLALKPNPFILFVPLLGIWLLWRRRWRVVAGVFLSAAAMFLVSNAVQPGWLLDWLGVSAKTRVTMITPTIWGLAAELSAQWWPLLGFILAVMVTVICGCVVLGRPRLEAASVVNIGLAASLLVTPYTWSYEHALLILPWLWIYLHLPASRPIRILWLLVMGMLPWLTYVLAESRNNDRLAFVVPLVTLCALLWTVLRRRTERTAASTRPSGASAD